MLAVTVEDHQVEFIELVDEELAGREGDEGQFLGRRSVLLFGRAQNCKVHQIDRGIGFQEIAPRAFARMRFARYQENPEPVANAFNDGDGAVVLVRDFTSQRRHGDLDDVLPAVIDGHGDFDGLAGGQRDGLRVAAANDDSGIKWCAGTIGFLDMEGDGLVLADDAEAWGLVDHYLAVALGFGTGEQAVNRAADVALRQVGGRIVNLAVGHHDGASETLRGNFRQRAVQGLEGARAVILRADAGFHFDDAQLSVAEPRYGLFEGGFRRIGAGDAAAISLAERTVDDGDGDIGQGFAFLVADRGVGQCRDKKAECQHTQHGTARPGIDHRRRQHGTEEGEPDDQGPGQDGIEVQSPAHYWPSLSRRAGTWTWSAL